MRREQREEEKREAEPTSLLGRGWEKGLPKSLPKSQKTEQPSQKTERRWKLPQVP